MIVLPPMCLKCKHFKILEKEHWFKCSAFPRGIPNEIIYGRFDHRHKYPGDKGIRFELKVQRDIEELNDRMVKGVTENLDEFLEKGWSNWRKFRKPKYDPSNRKSISACKRYAQMGIFKPGCSRALQLAETVYEPGRDDYNYIPSTAVDPKKLMSNNMTERDGEVDKKRALESTDMLYNNANFVRQQDGKISIDNWRLLSDGERQTLSALFDQNGILYETKYREFDSRFKDYNNRRISRGMAEKKIL